jgi:hypothetical protein
LKAALVASRFPFRKAFATKTSLNLRPSQLIREFSMANHPKMSLDMWIERWQAAQAASYQSHPVQEEGKAQRPFRDLELHSRKVEAETVLLVEDEDVIRDLVREILRPIR